MAMDPNTQQTVQRLNAAWRNYITDQLTVDKKTFKLAQGTLGLVTSDNSGLFRMSDNVPPNLDIYDAGSANSFASGYQLLLTALLPETGESLRTALGNNYTGWIAFRQAYFQENPTTTKTQLEIFEIFANQRLDPNAATKAISVYKTQLNSQLNIALDQYNNADFQQTFTPEGGSPYTLRTYSATTTDATPALNRGTSASFAFDSSTEESKVTETQVQASASGFYDIFSGGASVNFDQLNKKAATSAITVEGSIDKYATLPTQPGGWFTSGEYSRAYNAKNDNTIWDPDANAGGWDSFFAQPKGSLARRVSQLLLITGYTMTMTSKATYSQEDFQKITTEASFGVWPFFSGTASATHTSDYKLNSASQLVATHTLNKGLIQIWGVNILDAPNVG